MTTSAAPRAGTRVGVTLLSFFGPALLLGAAAAWYLRPEAWVPSVAVTEMDTRVAAAADPVAVVIGSSWARSDIDTPTLASALGLRADQVIALTQNKSYPAIWYAIAKYRLFDAGRRPKLLLLVTSLPSLTVVDPASGSLADLEQHFPSADEVLLRKVWGDDRPALWTRLMNRRAEPRDAVLQAVRASVARPAAALWSDDGTPLDPDAAGTLVFGETAGNGAAVAQRFLPVQEEEEQATGRGADEVSAEQSFLADLAALAAAHDSRLVVVLAPVARTVASPITQVAPGVEADFVAYANAHGIGWLDLRGMDFAPSSFPADGSHMYPHAARRFTTEVAERLQAIGALTDGPLKRASRVAARTVVRTGGVPTPVPLPTRALKAECRHGLDLGRWSMVAPRAMMASVGAVGSPLRVTLPDGAPLPPTTFGALNANPCTLGVLFDGKNSLVAAPPEQDVSQLLVGPDPALPDPASKEAAAWWVYPGSGIEWTLEGVPDGGATLALALRAIGDGPPPTVTVDGTPVPLTEGAEGLTARHPLAGSSAVVHIAAPDGGAWGLVRRFTVAADAVETDIVARPLSQRLDALATFQAAAAPPPLAQVFVAQPNGAQVAELPWVATPACHPYRVEVDGAPVPTKGDEGLNWAFQRGTIAIGKLAAPRLPNPHLSLDPERQCGTRACPTCTSWHWVYPGDVLRAEVDKARRMRLVSPLRVASLRAEPIVGGAATGQLRLVVRIGDEVLSDSTHPVATLSEGVSETLSRFVPRTDPTPVAIEVYADGLDAPVKLLLELVST